MQKLLLVCSNLRDHGTAGCHRGWVGQLTELHLTGNRLTAVPPVLAAATKLRQLHMQKQYIYG